MRRAPIIISATVLGTAAILGFHAHDVAAPIASPSVSAGSSGSPSPAGGSGSSASASRSAASSSSTTSSPGTTSATGDAMNTQYGPAQVKVTVSAGQITKIEAVQIQNADRKSQLISAYAAPILQQSALTRQTAAVDTVSGATYTSLSYEASLQSALDKLGYRAADGSAASTDVSQLQ